MRLTYLIHGWVTLTLGPDRTGDIPRATHKSLEEVETNSTIRTCKHHRLNDAHDDENWVSDSLPMIKTLGVAMLVSSSSSVKHVLLLCFFFGGGGGNTRRDCERVAVERKGFRVPPRWQVTQLVPSAGSQAPRVSISSLDRAF